MPDEEFLFSLEDLLNKERIRAPSARKKLKSTPDELIQTLTHEQARKEAERAQEELEKQASVDKFTDDGSLDFLPHPQLTPTGNEEFMFEREKRVDVKPIRLYEDEELDQVISLGPENNANYDNAWNEKLLRSRWEKQSFFENLRDADYVKRKGARITQQFISGPARIPGQVASLGGMITALPELGLKEAGVVEEADVTETLLSAGAEYNQEINKAFNTSDPENPAEMLAQITSQAMLRIPGVGPRTLVGNIAELATPLTIGGGGGRIAANIGTQFIGHEALRPIISPEGDDYETIFQQFFTPTEVQVATADPELDFEVGVGPQGQKLKNSDLLKLGVLGLGSIGLGLAPSIVRAWRSKPIATSKIIDDTGISAPKELVSVEKWQDLYKTFLTSPIDGLKSISKRVGIDSKELFDAVETNTNAALNQKVNTALRVGVARTLDGDYIASAPAMKIRGLYDSLDDQSKTLANRYAILKDTLDDMNINGMNFLNGISKRDLLKELRRLDKASNGQMKKLHDAYKSLQKSNLNFAASGKYALFSRKKFSELNKTRQNYVPWELEMVDPGLSLAARASKRANIYGARATGIEEATPFLMRRNPNVEERNRVNPYDLLVSSTENIIKAKTENAVRGQIIDALRASNVKNLAVRVTDKQLKENPHWVDRSISFRRAGVPEHYVLSQGLADIIRFDPNFAKHPWLFGASRAFQFGTTGYGAPWFAVKHFLRDSIAADVLTPKGYKRTGIVPYIGPTKALGSQLYWQAVRGLASHISKNLELGSGGVLRNAFGEENLRAFADNLADSYMRSSYHIFTSEGGLDVNMAHNAYRLAKNAMDEIGNSVNLPPHVTGMAHIWKNFIDSIQNAPHYAWLSRNKKWLEKRNKRSLTKTEMQALIATERELTGNITEGGKVFTRTGRIIGTNKQGGDIVNEGVMSALAPTVGKVTQFFREGSPWTNALIQGLKQTGKAYVNNPWAFIGRMYSIVLIPQLLSYMSAAAMGPAYLEHLLTRRSEYDKSTGIYIPPFWQGEDALPEDGLEIPLPLEIAPLGYMFLNLLDHVFRPDADHVAIRSVASNMMKNFFGLTMPPIVVSGIGLAFNSKVPGTIGEGDIYSPDENPYSPLPSNVELAIRGLMGSSFDVYMNGVMSFMEEGDVGSALKEMTYRVKQKTPLVQKKQLHSFTDITERDFEFGDKLDEFEKVYKSWDIDPETGMIFEKDIKKNEDKPLVEFEDGSLLEQTVPMPLKSGGVSKSKTIQAPHEDILKSLPMTRMGLPPMPAPTNPVYILAANKIYELFEKKGNNFGRAKGFLKTATEQIRSLKRVNYGNLEEFKRRVEELPDDNEAKQFLMEFDLNSRDSVREAINQLEKARVRVRQIVELYMKEAEDELSQELGQQVKLLELEPYE